MQAQITFNESPILNPAISSCGMGTWALSFAPRNTRFSAFSATDQRRTTIEAAIGELEVSHVFFAM